MLIKSLKLTSFLSYGPESEAVPLGPLNILIGPNGSGKSNFLEALSILQAAPGQLTKPIRDGGGIQDWLYKSESSAARRDARIEALIANPQGNNDFRYGLALNQEGGRLAVRDEFLENEQAAPGREDPYFYYRWNEGRPVLNTRGIGERKLVRETIKPDQSILAQKRDADLYPEMTWLADQFDAIRLYREWTFGRYATPRLQQRTDLPSDRLEQDYSNLALVINRLKMHRPAWKQFMEGLRLVYEGIEDMHVQINDGGNAQIFLIETSGPIPATRLSDGTLRYLALLTVLCDPAPPPLIVLEEPELGLHPDILPQLAHLLSEASTRAQWIVTTHAPAFVDAFSERPENILVCERDPGGTREPSESAEPVGARGASGSRIERLDATDMAPWLEKYRLGDLWMRGQIGGTRW
ncbi:AAA family ATPase [Acidovorax sp. SUPP3334]|uniref:AAA family ATPase n=1 Tax=Acidovorax sp. SUPP3334 TaxID=2920881 RepID=UPI0023DE5186|nr:AAA family ATPase [Acidovorax sp. SUPP3334]GKT21367.1 AAA family ATPase [Acidovorax sp. SUPP3334]